MKNNNIFAPELPDGYEWFIVSRKWGASQAKHEQRLVDYPANVYFHAQVKGYSTFIADNDTILTCVIVMKEPPKFNDLKVIK